jgi:hypothetical protein
MNNIDNSSLEKIILFFGGDKRAIDFINFNYDGIEFDRSNNSSFIQNMLVCENFKDQYGCVHKNDWNYKILPLLDIEYTKNYHCYLKTNPQEFLICMKRMSIQISKLGYNTFQYFPLRTTIIPKYIPLDTKSIIELFMDDKAKYFSDIDKYKEQI